MLTSHSLVLVFVVRSPLSKKHHFNIYAPRLALRSTYISDMTSLLMLSIYYFNPLNKHELWIFIFFKLILYYFLLPNFLTKMIHFTLSLPRQDYKILSPVNTHHHFFLYTIKYSIFFLTHLILTLTHLILTFIFSLSN